MLKRENRLTKNRHFNYIYKRGQKSFAKDLYVVFVPTRIQPIKIGFSVSNKVGDAVDRNRVRRRMREIVRAFLSTMNKKYNYVFVAKSSIIDLYYDAIKKEMIYVMKKAGLLSE